MSKELPKVWALYDGRYYTDPDRATIFELCYELEEAKENRTDYGDDTVIVQFDELGDELINPKVVSHE